MKKKFFISVKPCPMLYVPPNAMISPVNCTKGPSLGGAICTVTCKAGYTLIGQPKVTCGSTGQWMGGNVATYVCRGEFCYNARAGLCYMWF
jgi:hypothetical protein